MRRAGRCLRHGLPIQIWLTGLLFWLGCLSCRAARLRLPDTLSLHDKYEYVEDLIGRMGLNKVADTIVGDEKTRGISGGEKKRLSLACELIGSPSLIFADEPTSGLDAFQVRPRLATPA